MTTDTVGSGIRPSTHPGPSGPASPYPPGRDEPQPAAPASLDAPGQPARGLPGGGEVSVPMREETADAADHDGAQPRTPTEAPPPATRRSAGRGPWTRQADTGRADRHSAAVRPLVTELTEVGL